MSSVSVQETPQPSRWYIHCLPLTMLVCSLLCPLCNYPDYINKKQTPNMHPHTYVYMHAHAHTVIRAQTHKICDFSDVSPPSTQLRSINVGETNGFLLRGAITRRPPDNDGVTRLDLQNKDTLCSFLVTPPNIKCTDDEIKITISIHE